MLENVLLGLQNLFTGTHMLVCAVGLIAGIVFGALPGFSATMGCAVMIPFTYSMEPSAALLLLSGVYCGGVYGGSIPAILLGIPGTPASAPTAFEGRALTQQGKAGKALGICTYGSALGGLVSSIALICASPLLAKLAVMVGPPEQMMIAIFGLSVVCMLSPETFFKGLLVACVALLLATIGQDPLFGFPRFTFGSLNLYGGVSLVPILIGLFSLPEVITMLESEDGKLVESAKVGSLFFKLSELKGSLWNTIRSILIGIGIGIVPAAGPDIAAFLSYNQAKRGSKHPEEYGKGSTEGIIASECANNAVTGGSLIPMLTLGIPGESVTAVLMGGLIIHGLQPGPELFTTYAGMTYTFFAGFVLVQFFMLGVGMLGCKGFAQISRLSDAILIPSIFLLCVVGSYAIHNNVVEVAIMLIFGVIGYLARKFDFNAAAIVLGLILGPIGERGLRRSLLISDGDPSILFSTSLCWILIALCVLGVLSPLLMERMERRMRESAES